MNQEQRKRVLRVLFLDAIVSAQRRQHHERSVSCGAPHGGHSAAAKQTQTEVLVASLEVEASGAMARRTTRPPPPPLPEQSCVLVRTRPGPWRRSSAHGAGMSGSVALSDRGPCPHRRQRSRTPWRDNCLNQHPPKEPASSKRRTPLNSSGLSLTVTSGYASDPFGLRTLKVPKPSFRCPSSMER